MGIISSVANHTLGAGWNTVKDTVRGAANGDIGDIAKVAVVASVAAGSLPAATGAALLAGDAVLGTLFDALV
ncbi:MAG: hypothetical protein QM581_01980 [Pseudomonas sp.]